MYKRRPLLAEISLNFTQKTHNANETKKKGKFTHVR